MPAPVEIMMRDVTVPAALETRIRRYASRLEHIDRQIRRCRVSVERKSSGEATRPLWSVCVEVTVPRDDIMVTRFGENLDGEDADRAVAAAFDDVTRQLEEHQRTLRASGAPWLDLFA